MEQAPTQFCSVCFAHPPLWFWVIHQCAFRTVGLGQAEDFIEHALPILCSVCDTPFSQELDRPTVTDGDVTYPN